MLVRFGAHRQVKGLAACTITQATRSVIRNLVAYPANSSNGVASPSTSSTTQGCPWYVRVDHQMACHIKPIHRRQIRASILRR